MLDVIYDDNVLLFYKVSSVLPKGKLNENFGGTDGSNPETDSGKYRC